MKLVQVAFAVLSLSGSAPGQLISGSGSARHNIPAQGTIPVA